MGKKTNKVIDIEVVCSMIIEGKRWADIAVALDMPISTLHENITKNAEFSARVMAAKDISSEGYADKAEKVLLDAKSTKVEIQRARELAQHYRWMAGKRSPKKYGDKLDVTSDGKAINQSVVVPTKDAASDVNELKG